MKKMILILLILLVFLFTSAAYAGKLAALPGHLVPNALAVGDNYFYITENSTVYVYSMKDFKLVKKFGKKGEGPREFKGTSTLTVLTDQLMVNSTGKVSFYTIDGTYLKEFNNIVSGHTFNQLGSRFIGRKSLPDKKGQLWATVNIYDSSFNKVIALDAGVDDINHLASFGKKSDALIRRIVKSGVYWIPTIEPIPPSHRERGIDAFRRFIKAGGKVALGNDSGSLPDVQVGMPIKEIQLMHDAGMTPMEIIAAATRHAALVCNLEDQPGTLQPGKLADVLVVEGNPLEDLQTLTNIRLVIHEGVIIRKE
jgi:hypothetical protein